MNSRRLMEREKKDAELAEEIESHLAHEEDANGALGLSSEEAHRSGAGEVRQSAGDAVSGLWRYRSRPWIEDLWRDLRFCAALAGEDAWIYCDCDFGDRGGGIGVNTAVFSVVNTVLLKAAELSRSSSLWWSW